MEILDDNLKSETGLQFTAPMFSSLKEQAYWARLLGMTGMIFIGLTLLIILIMGGTFFALLMGSNELSSGMGGVGFLAILFYIFIFGIGGYMSFLLWDFGRKIRVAIDTNNQDLLEIGSAKLALLFKINGILTVILLAIYGVILFFGILAGGSAALMR